MSKLDAQTVHPKKIFVKKKSAAKAMDFRFYRPHYVNNLEKSVAYFVETEDND
jgi:hypothetical protein